MTEKTADKSAEKAKPKQRKADQTPAPAMRAGEFARWLWTQITSMRTALVLLFLLALAAIPGGLIPQTPVSPIRVSDFRKAHPVLDKIYHPLGMYNVYSSPWFSAIYLLLFVSLIGCILPRVAVYAKALRNPPPAVPSRLDRLPEWGRATSSLNQTEALAAAAAWLKKKNFRVLENTDRAGRPAISAERGYLREFGNLVFHISLVVMLLGIAWNNLLGFKGTAVVVEGQGFSNNITQYDEYHAGVWVNTDDLPPFTVKLKKFLATFESGPVQRGAARSFEAQVEVTEDGKTTAKTIKVNHPLTIDGTKVHILGHGYTAHVTVKDKAGNIAFSGPVIFQPMDGNFTSVGVINVPDARPERLAFQGFFLPTAVVDDKGPRSVFPDALNAEIFLNAWYGPPKVEDGRPQNVHVLDTTGLKQITQNGQVTRFRMQPGESFVLPDGLGTVTFDGWSRWSKLQLSQAPGLPLTFGSLAIGITGLCLSLFIRPRRLWLQASDDDRAELTAGGLDRADSRTGLADDVADLLQAAGALDEGDPAPKVPESAVPDSASATTQTQEQTS